MAKGISPLENLSFSLNTSLPSSNKTSGELFIGDVLVVGVLVLTTLVGVIGNVLVCIVVHRLARRSSMDFFIKALAGADLGILLVIVPLILIRIQLNGQWPLGRFLCRAFYPVQDVFYGVSIWLIVTIAVERRRSIVQLAGGFRRRSLKSSRMIVLAISTFNFFVFAFPLYFMMEYVRRGNAFYCLVVWPKWSEVRGQRNIVLQAHTVLIVLVGYVVPLAVIVWTYVSISRHLKKSSNFIKESFIERRCKSQAEESRLKQNVRAKRLLTPVVVVFAVTMLPLNILRFLVLYTVVPARYFSVIFPLFCLLVVINSVANPFIYSITNARFRRRLKRLFSLESSRTIELVGLFSFRRSTVRKEEGPPLPSTVQ